MATIQLPPDFKEFLKLLNSSNVEYLVVGGYAVNYYGYPRATADLCNPPRQCPAFDGCRPAVWLASVDSTTFLEPRKVVRMGVPPVRLENLTSISGVDFQECYGRRVETDWDGVPVPLIDLPDLKLNKKAAGRLKDLLDLEQLKG